ncbi:SDR family NAD(P)-dependent oxidoreductase [Hugenholtzia roseola]|uniref:SDR family NAD(P)-dependent oxidoreductase n=1 Tax=Hugenholtzia roseola TaxID=1002 RepID=UPI000409A754|nr:SDR family NAD(P)-dependent oxidoreductase [Hugenholtzia roseola]
MQKTYLITGATSGIGKMTALAVAKASPKNTVIFNARNLEKGEEVRQELIKASGNENIYCFEGDFASLASVKSFAQKVQEKFPTIDVLLNNAGTWEMEFKESKDGIEMNFAVNHLAPFLLTLLLLPALKKSTSARIINTASGAHRRNILQFDDIEFRKGEYNGFFSYSQSKLCNLLFSLQLEAELAKENIQNITVNSLHPGVVKTALFDKMNQEERSFFGNFVSPEEGAMTSIYLTLSNEVEGITGKYWHKHSEAVATDMAKDPHIAQKLWEVSLKYVQNYL